MKNKILSRGIKIIIWVNLTAAVITLFFWGLVFLKIYAVKNTDFIIDNVTKASTLGFLVADIIWAVPLLIMSVNGLKKMNLLGLLTAQMANILWFYSMTSLWVRDLYLGTISPGNYIFLPFTIFSIWSAYYLWNKRENFQANQIL